MDATAVAQSYASASEDTRHLVDRLLTQDDDDRAWAAQLGPAYRQGDVARLLGKSKQAVSSDRRLLKLEMRNGEVGYPAFQFDGRRQLPGIRDVIAVLDSAVATAWTTASWLTSPTAALDGQTPAQALRRGAADPVLALARRTARAMAA